MFLVIFGCYGVLNTQIKKDKATNSLRISCLFVFLGRDIQQMSLKINKIDKESGFASGSSLFNLDLTLLSLYYSIIFL